MTTLAEVGTGLQDCLASTGLYAYDHSAANPLFPVGLVIPPEINYRETMGLGVVTLGFELVILVGASLHENQKQLFDYLDWVGDHSVLAAVAANRTLGLTGVDAVVMSSRPLGLEEVGGYQSFGAALVTAVTIKNT